MNKNYTAIMVAVVFVVCYLFYSSCEGFETQQQYGVQRCGVDLPSCVGIRCINGYCRSDVAPTLPLSDLPMYPSAL